MAPTLDPQTFHRQGFAHLPGALPLTLVNQVREDARNVFLRQMRHQGLITAPPVDEAGFLAAMATFFRDHRTAFINCGKTAQHLVSLHRLGLDERLLQAVLEVGVTIPNICTRPVLYFNHRDLAEREVFYKTPAHQDWSSMQGSLNATVVWVPLCDVDIPLGTIQVVPGSHLWGLLPCEDDYGFGKIDSLPEHLFKPVPVKAGDMLIFSAFLVHRSGDNVLDRVRWSCHFRYNDLAEPTFIARQYPNPYLYKPLSDVVTPEFPTPEQLQVLHRSSVSSVSEGHP